jgi:hypothetical protein
MVNLRVPPDKAILLIRERIDDIQNIREKQDGPEYYDFVGWLSKTWSVIDEIYGTGDTHPEEMRIIGLPSCPCNSEKEAQMLVDLYRSRLLDYINEILISVKTPEKI